MNFRYKELIEDRVAHDQRTADQRQKDSFGRGCGSVSPMRKNTDARDHRDHADPRNRGQVLAQNHDRQEDGTRDATPSHDRIKRADITILVSEGQHESVHGMKNPGCEEQYDQFSRQPNLPQKRDGKKPRDNRAEEKRKVNDAVIPRVLLGHKVPRCVQQRTRQHQKER